MLSFAVADISLTYTLQISFDITSFGPKSRILTGDLTTSSVIFPLSLRCIEQSKLCRVSERGSSRILDSTPARRRVVCDACSHVIAAILGLLCSPNSLRSVTDFNKADGGTCSIPPGLTLNKSNRPGPPCHLYAISACVNPSSSSLLAKSSLLDFPRRVIREFGMEIPSSLIRLFSR